MQLWWIISVSSTNCGVLVLAIHIGGGCQVIYIWAEVWGVRKWAIYITIKHLWWIKVGTWYIAISHIKLYCALCMLIVLGADSISKFHITGIGNPIWEIRRSYDRLISTLGFSLLVRWHIYIEAMPWFSGDIEYIRELCTQLGFCVLWVVSVRIRYIFQNLIHCQNAKDLG